MAGRVRRAALLIACGAAALACTACGSSSRATDQGLRLQREDLIAAARALEKASPEVQAEVGATKAAWPLIANGLRSPVSSEEERTIAAAARTAAALHLPSVFGELRAAELTGPASSISGSFRSYAGLAARGWQMILYALGAERAGGGGASFARANVALYIESVYDAHFGLSQIGKKLIAGYDKLGGPAAFGSALPRSEAQRLAGVYSESRYRLHPHDGVKLGS